MKNFKLQGNILISGPKASGKTTLADAISMGFMATFPCCRIAILDWPYDRPTKAESRRLKQRFDLLIGTVQDHCDAAAREEWGKVGIKFRKRLTVALVPVIKNPKSKIKNKICLPNSHPS